MQHDRAARFLASLYDAGFMARGGRWCARTSMSKFLNLVPLEHVEGLHGCLDYYRDVRDPFSIELLNRYEAGYPGSAMFSPGSACTGTYRALKMWQEAVHEPGSLKAARRHRRRGGPAQMVPGPAPRAYEPAHRPLRERDLQGGREPWPHRSAGVRGPPAPTAVGAGVALPGDGHGEGAARLSGHGPVRQGGQRAPKARLGPRYDDLPAVACPRCLRARPRQGRSPGARRRAAAFRSRSRICHSLLTSRLAGGRSSPGVAPCE